jgi:two-component system KDP operon response regulator KdpE
MARKILIIDDSTRVRRRLRSALEQEGLHVVEQEPSDRPVQQTLSSGYAVILLDVVMPEKDGFEYLREFRRLWPEQRLVVYSAGLSDYTHYAVKLGADAGIDIGPPARLRQLVETARRLAAEADEPGGAGPRPGNGDPSAGPVSSA